MNDKKEVRREVKGDATTVFYDDGTEQKFLAMWDPVGTTRMEVIKAKLAGKTEVLDEILDEDHFMRYAVAKELEDG